MTIIPFQYDAVEVRVVQINGEPWFVLADLCRVLDLSNPSEVARRIDSDALSTAEVIDTLGRAQSARIVDEGGMYEVVMLSRKPEAAAVRRWITREVLPSIRKTGGYGVQKQLTEEEIVAQALQITAAKVQQLEAKVAEDAPKVAYVDTFVADADLRILRDVAKSLGVQEKRLRAALVEHGWIYVERETRWSRSEGRKIETVRYSHYAHKADYFRPVPRHDAPRFRGEVDHTLKVTPAGAEAIARAVVRWGLVDEDAA